LKVTFQNGSVYEFFGVSNNHYKKLTQAPSQERYARRHIFSSHVYRNLMKSDTVD
jgi:hypothetical protein